MTHPEELLAGYVDGTLPARERGVVDAHLAECSRCQQEVVLASSARSTLRSLADVPAPANVATRALQEARGIPQQRAGGGTPRWYRMGGIAAAAAAVIVLAITLPHIGKSTTPITDAARANAKVGAGGAAPATALPASAIEIQQTNYDNASLSALSASYAGGGAAAGLSTPTPGATESTAVITGTPAQTAKALACIVQSAPSEAGQPTRLISARFQGTPAYLEVFLEGPGADQPPDSVVVWVFATKDCAILSFSQARL